MFSLEKDPDKKGKPHKEKDGTKNKIRIKLFVIFLFSNFRISCVCKECITKPLDRNSNDLKNAWLNK